MLAWRMRSLLLVWFVQNVAFRGERNKSPDAFNRAAFEAFTSAVGPQRNTSASSL